MKRTVFSFLFLALCLLPGCEQARSGPEEMVPLWRQLYGEEAVVKLPGRDAYALLRPGWSEAPEDYGLIEFTPSDDPRWEEVYEGDACSLRVKDGHYRPGDTVTLLLENNTGEAFSYGDEFLLEYETAEGWYPVFSRFRRSDLIEYGLGPNGVREIELSSAQLWFSAGRMLRYDAESGGYEYERVLNRERELRLIPGRYRYLMSVSYGQRGGMNLACEFTIGK